MSFFAIKLLLKGVFSYLFFLVLVRSLGVLFKINEVFGFKGFGILNIAGFKTLNELESFRVRGLCCRNFGPSVI